MTNKTKLVVVNGNMLGYVMPHNPSTFNILQGSVTRGADRFWGESLPIGTRDIVRLASEKDFEDFRVVFDGYKNNSHDYEFAT